MPTTIASAESFVVSQVNAHEWTLEVMHDPKNRVAFDDKLLCAYRCDIFSLKGPIHTLAHKHLTLPAPARLSASEPRSGSVVGLVRRSDIHRVFASPGCERKLIGQNNLVERQFYCL